MSSRTMVELKEVISQVSSYLAVQICRLVSPNLHFLFLAYGIAEMLKSMEGSQDLDFQRLSVSQSLHINTHITLLIVAHLDAFNS